MDWDASELTKEQLEYLKPKTNYSSQELRDWHRRFYGDYPSGRIDRDQFVTMYSKMLPDGDTQEFAEHVFRTYDRDGNGSIDFREFIITVGTTQRGSLQDKLSWLFCLYDVNNDGALTRKEIVEVLLSMYRMQGKDASELVLDAEDTALRVFVAIDKDRNDYMSCEEFVGGIEKCDVIKDLQA